jgi:hypothetical protein
MGCYPSPIHTKPSRHSTMREFTFSLRHSSGATEALTIDARDEAHAREQINSIYPGSTISWIL